MDETETTVTPELPDELTLVLRKPVTFAKVEHTELNLSEPTVGQLKRADMELRPMAGAAMLIHLNSKVPMGAVEQLSQRDFQDAMDFFNRFGSASAPTSAT